MFLSSSTNAMVAMAGPFSCRFAKYKGAPNKEKPCPQGPLRRHFPAYIALPAEGVRTRPHPEEAAAGDRLEGLRRNSRDGHSPLSCSRHEALRAHQALRFRLRGAADRPLWLDDHAERT